MTIALVTGATGFLGGWLVRHLATLEYETHVIHRSGSDPQALNQLAAMGARLHAFNSMEELRNIAGEIGPDVVFHLATFYLKDHRPQDVHALIEANVTFGAELLEGVLEANPVVVSAMSYFQFEEGIPHSFSLYSATKQAFLEICNYYRDVRHLDVRQVVLYDTYGPGDSRNKLVPRLVAALSDGTRVTMGSPEQQLNLLYAEDVARGLVAASGSGAPEFMALRSPKTASVSAIVAAFEAAGGSQLDKEFNEAAVVNRLVHTSNQWPKPPGWDPLVDLATGASLTLDLA